MEKNNPQALKSFLQEYDFITLQEARGIGFSAMALSRLVTQGNLFRVARGIYANKLEWMTHPLKKYAPVCTIIPEAVICGISALTYYDLTNDEERKIWVALPEQKRIVDNRYHIIRMSSERYTLGIKKQRIGKRYVKIYEIEKAIIDAFKFNTEETAIKALKRYLARKNNDIPKLYRYAKKLRRQLAPIIRSLITDE